MIDLIVDGAVGLLLVALGWGIGKIRESLRWRDSAYALARRSIRSGGRKYFVLTQDAYEEMLQRNLPILRVTKGGKDG